MTFCTLFPNQEMGKSLSAQRGGDLTESLALGFQAWHQAPPPPKGTWRVGQGGTCPLPSVGSQGEFRVWAWQPIPPGRGMRLLFLCSSKPGFSLGSWWRLLTRCDRLTRVICVPCSSLPSSLQTTTHRLSSDHHCERWQGSS